MNILLCTWMLPDPHTGGIERVTYNLFKGFSAVGNRTFVLYESSLNRDINSIADVSACQIDYNAEIATLTRYIDDWGIDVIIIQDVRFAVDSIYKSAILAKNEPKIIYCYHFNPGESYKYITAQSLWSITLQQKTIWSFLRYMSSPIYKQIVKYEYIRTLRRAYSKCDAFVMLSKGYFNEMREIIGLKNASKLYAIPNPLSFDHPYSISSLCEKQRKVLIVSRMVQHPKNILQALEIWKDIEADSNYDDWHLDIVGDGKDLPMFKTYAQNNLKRVNFWGKQNPIEFYKQSSIFLMTSEYEGWGLTLTEAQQFGNVCVAYKASESTSDIVKEGCGFVISNREKSLLLNKLKLLMSDDSLRIKMAINARKSIERFSLTYVVEQWTNLIKHIGNK